MPAKPSKSSAKLPSVSDERPIDHVVNIGKVTAGWLNEIGVFTLGDLKALGVIETYRRLKRTFPKRVSLNALYGLEAALQNIPWQAIDEETKAQLRAAVAQADATEQTPE
jgi:DNA transformation protein